MAAGVTPTSHVPRPTSHAGLPFASKRRAAIVRDSGAFLAARPPVRRSTLNAQRSTATPRIAATANLDVPDAAPPALAVRTARQDVVALALAFAAGIGGPAAWLVIRAML